MDKKTVDTKIDRAEHAAPRRRRGRPRKFSAEKGVEVAQALFHAHGYDAVGIAELRDAMGASPTSIYAAFGSKFVLFERVLENYSSGSAGAFLPCALGHAATVEEAVRGVLLAAALQYGSDTDRPGCMVLNGSVSTEDRGARDVMVSMVRMTEDALTNRFAALHAQAPRALAKAVVTAMHGLSASARSGASSDELTRDVDMFLNGLTRGAA